VVLEALMEKVSLVSWAGLVWLCSLERAGYRCSICHNPSEPDFYSIEPNPFGPRCYLWMENCLAFELGLFSSMNDWGLLMKLALFTLLNIFCLPNFCLILICLYPPQIQGFNASLCLDSYVMKSKNLEGPCSEFWSLCYFLWSLLA
jgi:hypothetical protein